MFSLFQVLHKLLSDSRALWIEDGRLAQRRLDNNRPVSTCVACRNDREKKEKKENKEKKRKKN